MPKAAKKGVAGVDGVHLADATKCKVYVYFDGLLGTHLKPEGEYKEA